MAAVARMIQICHENISLLSRSITQVIILDWLTACFLDTHVCNAKQICQSLSKCLLCKTDLRSPISPALHGVELGDPVPTLSLHQIYFQQPALLSPFLHFALQLWQHPCPEMRREVPRAVLRGGINQDSEEALQVIFHYFPN